MKYREVSKKLKRSVGRVVAPTGLPVWYNLKWKIVPLPD
jgi:hypothetical protein